MKYLLLVFLLININCYSQAINFKKEWPTLTTAFLSGAADGTAETLRDHYHEFKITFPNANDQFWNPSISWKNKYRNGDYTQGPKFPLSTTALVWVTDGFHLMRFSKNTLMVTTIALNVRGKKKFKHHLLNVAIHTASYHAGFNVFHRFVFRDPSR